MQARSSLSSPLFITDRKGAFALFGSLFFLMISIAGYAGLYLLNRAQDNTQAALIQQIEQKEDDLRPKLLDQIALLQKRIQVVSTVLASHPFAQNTFRILERDTHPRVSFNSYSFKPEDRAVVLKGNTDSYSILAEQIAFLEGDPQIDRVEFGGLTINEQGKVSFNVTIHLIPSAITTIQ